MTSIAPLGGEAYTVPQTGNPDNMKKAAKFVAVPDHDANELALAKARNTVPSKAALAAQYTTENPRMAAFVQIAQPPVRGPASSAPNGRRPPPPSMPPSSRR